MVEISDKISILCHLKNMRERIEIVKLLVMTNTKANVFHIDNVQHVRSGANDAFGCSKLSFCSHRTLGSWWPDSLNILYRRLPCSRHRYFLHFQLDAKLINTIDLCRGFSRFFQINIVAVIMRDDITVSCNDVAGHRPATSWVHYTTNCNTQSSAPEDG